MSWGGFFYPHTVIVRDRRQVAGMGSTLGEPRTLRAEVKDEAQLVRDASGAEVVSSSQVTVPLDANVAPGAQVTLWPGTPQERTAGVLNVARNENAAPLDSFLLLTLK
ncbi:hypothetical protein L332_03595 [Agrococcus pavilionensis RW1]|uniref:Uncharacterized protein n=1 Tax=Agrococcus pavilionensis RW1 TaxID=1330458 RepID=U1MS94_9MICO|nr:hypothetical protein [Agrococcus pavilionensis]ERG63535.1 hypothetical protein L332_03595 [Agrococcus pavilionensis RW1]